MKKIFSFLVFIAIMASLKSQTLFVPSGTSGIGSSSTANIGFGTSNPDTWFGGTSGAVFEMYGNRPVLKLNNTGGLSTITLTNPAIDGTYHTGEYHLNYVFNSTNNYKSQLQFSSYPQQNVLVLQSDGKVGIGSNSFDTQNDYKLEVFGKAKVIDQFVVKGYVSGDMVGVYNLEPDLPSTIDLIFGSYGWDVSQVNNPSLLRLNGPNGATRFVVRNNGQVGIGIDPGNSSTLLMVNGKITATELEVKLEVAADYVFHPDYNLKTLAELEQYINENGHLPEIPSAEEIKQSGLNVGEFQNLLLQKIEEITLYMIDLKKENNALKEIIQKNENK